MASTYKDLVRSNLEDLRLVALFHPRLALVGVASEIENLYKELLPHRVNTWATRVQAPHPETKAVTHHIRMQKWSSALPIKLRQFASSLFESEGGGAYRHSRKVVTVPQVIENVRNALALLEALGEIYYPKHIRCQDHRATADWHLAAVLNAEPGTVIKVVCPKGKEVVYSYSVPNPGETQGPFSYIDKAGVEVFLNELSVLFCEQYASGLIDESQLQAKCQILES